MGGFETIIELQDILFPDFYTATDSEGNEYVFLKNSGPAIHSLDKVSDRTQLEAYENHVHISGRVRKRDRLSALAASKMIAINLVKKLGSRFPEKKFYVYLDCEFDDHIIIRFHQTWENEEPYYDEKCFPNMSVFKVG